MKSSRILAVALLAATVLAGPVRGQSQIPWVTDLGQAIELANRQQRLVLLHFWTESCIPCQELEKNVFNRAEVARAMTTGYIPVKINGDRQPQLVDYYKVQTFPTDIFVTPDGREIQRSVSQQDPNRYIAMLDQVRAQYGVGHYNAVARSGPMPNTTPPGSAPQQQTASPRPQQTAPQQAPPSGNRPGESSYVENQYFNPLDQNLPAQAANVGPRYATRSPQEGPQPANAGYGSPTDSAARPQPSQAAAGFGGAPAGSPTQSNTTPYGGAAAATSPPPQSYGGQPAARSTPASPTKASFGLDGYCPVTLATQRKWIKGDPRFGMRHRGRVYVFVGDRERQAFHKNPDRYAPILSGYDLVTFAQTGQLVEGRREHGVHFQGTIALFGSEQSLQRFSQNPRQFLDVLPPEYLQSLLPILQIATPGTGGQLR